MAFHNRNKVYLTSCRKCGGTTSKGFARHNDGQCKTCVTGEAPANAPKCPDCGGPIAAWKIRKGYHCDACTRAIEGPAYFSNEISYDGGF